MRNSITIIDFTKEYKKLKKMRPQISIVEVLEFCFNMLAEYAGDWANPILLEDTVYFTDFEYDAELSVYTVAGEITTCNKLTLDTFLLPTNACKAKKVIQMFNKGIK